MTVLALAGFVTLTAIGVIGALAIAVASPTATGACTAGLVLAIVTAMGGGAALETQAALAPLARLRPRRPRHRKPGRVITRIDGESK
jgi:hypothetical protein